MPAPTLVSQQQTVWNTNAATKTLDITVQTGDAVVIFGAISNSGTNNTLSVAGGGLTYTLQQSIAVSSSWGGLYCWTAIASSNQTFTLTMTQGGGSGVYGMHAQVWRGSGGIGTSAKANASGAPSLNIASSANSAIPVFINDWNSVDGASRVWRNNAGALTETVYNRNGSTMTVYGGYHADAGVAGTYAVGLTVPSQKYSIIGVELLAGTVANEPPTVTAMADLVDVEPYSNVELSETHENGTGTVDSVVWEQTAGAPVTIIQGPPAIFEAPGTIAGSTLTFQVTVSDTNDLTDTDAVNVTVLPVTERAVVGGQEVPMRTYGV